jgi:hypothetical protein
MSRFGSSKKKLHFSPHKLEIDSCFEMQKCFQSYQQRLDHAQQFLLVDLQKTLQNQNQNASLSPSPTSASLSNNQSSFATPRGDSTFNMSQVQPTPITRSFSRQDPSLWSDVTPAPAGKPAAAPKPKPSHEEDSAEYNAMVAAAKVAIERRATRMKSVRNTK